MPHVKQYEIKLENGDRKIINETDIKRGCLYYTEIGLGFWIECITEIRELPRERILDADGIRSPSSNNSA